MHGRSKRNWPRSSRRLTDNYQRDCLSRPLRPSPTLPSLCVSYATASRATTAPNKIQSRKGREIITRLIGDGRNGRGSSSIRIQSQSPPGRGNFAFRSLGCLEKRERSFTFSTPVDNYRAIRGLFILHSIVSFCKMIRRDSFLFLSKAVRFPIQSARCL